MADKLTVKIANDATAVTLPSIPLHEEKGSKTLDVKGQPKTFSIAHFSAKLVKTETVVLANGQTRELPGTEYDVIVEIRRKNPDCDRDNLVPKPPPTR